MCATLVSILGSSRGSPGRTLRKNLSATGAPLVGHRVIRSRRPCRRWRRRRRPGRRRRPACRPPPGRPAGGCRPGCPRTGPPGRGRPAERGGGLTGTRWRAARRNPGADGPVGDKGALAVGDRQLPATGVGGARLVVDLERDATETAGGKPRAAIAAGASTTRSIHIERLADRGVALGGEPPERVVRRGQRGDGAARPRSARRSPTRARAAIPRAAACTRSTNSLPWPSPPHR